MSVDCADVFDDDTEIEPTLENVDSDKYFLDDDYNEIVSTLDNKDTPRNVSLFCSK